MWSKVKLINFFQQNLKNEITIQKLNKSFFLVGEIELVDEIDLCGYKLFEAQLIQKTSRNIVFITLHENFVGINMKLLKKQFNEEEEKKYLIEIPYKYISVSGTEFSR